jgi:hypothetical protein
VLSSLVTHWFAVLDYQRSDVSKIAKIAKPALIAHRFGSTGESFDRGSL